MESLRSFRLKIVRESRKFILPKPQLIVNYFNYVLKQIRLGFEITLFDFLLVIISIVTLPIWYPLAYIIETYYHIKTKYNNYLFAKKFGVFGMYYINMCQWKLDNDL